MNSTEENKQKGNEAFKQKNFVLAIDYYTKAIELDPNNHVLYSNRSASFFGLKKYSESIQDAKKCIELKRDFVKGYYRLAQAVFELKDYPGANMIYKKALELDPKNVQIKKQIEVVERKLKIIQKKDNFIKNMSTLDGQIRIDLETINSYLHALANEKSKEISFDVFKLRSIILNLRFKEEEIMNLLTHFSFIKESFEKDSFTTLFIICCELYQLGFLVETQQYAKQLLFIKKDTDIYTMLAHIEIYLRGSNPLIHIRTIFTNELPLNYFSIKTYLELTSDPIQTIDEANKRLNEVLIILKSDVNFSYGWITENGLKAWFFLLNNTPGSIEQLTQSLDNEEIMIKILNTGGEQPLVKICTHQFFIQILSKNIIGRQDVEMFFVKLRRAFLNMKDFEINESLIPLMLGIACQSYLNEFIWNFQEDELSILNSLVDEIEKVEFNDKMTKKQRNKLILISMYQPLFYLKNFLKIPQPIDSSFYNFIKIQKFDKKYPRVFPKWNHFSGSLTKIPYHKMIEWDFPSIYWPDKEFEVEDKISRILVTGCSSGEILMKYLYKFSKCEIFGIDSNEESIQYIEEKLKNKNVNSIKLETSTDEKMKKNLKFDVIESYGTKNELNFEKSGTNLVNHLKEGGLIKFEFYTKKFVDLVFKTRKFLNHKNFKFFNETLEPQKLATENELRKMRREILQNEEFKMLVSRFEFYQLKSFSQILFQKNLKGMDFLDVEKLISKLNLKLISFVLSPQILEQYTKMYSYDKQAKKYKLLQQFDDKNHFTKDFISFYCEKPRTESQSETETENDPLGVKNYLQKFKK
eukprot:gene567-8077_t